MIDASLLPQSLRNSLGAPAGGGAKFKSLDKLLDEFGQVPRVAAHRAIAM
jgi:hypothetical protein